MFTHTGSQPPKCACAATKHVAAISYTQPQPKRPSGKNVRHSHTTAQVNSNLSPPFLFFLFSAAAAPPPTTNTSPARGPANILRGTCYPINSVHISTLTPISRARSRAVHITGPQATSTRRVYWGVQRSASVPSSPKQLRPNPRLQCAPRHALKRSVANHTCSQAPRPSQGAPQRAHGRSRLQPNSLTNRTCASLSNHGSPT